MKILPLIIFILLLTIKDISALECIYASKPTKDNPYNEIYPQGNCGEILNEDVLKLKKSHFERLSFSEDGLASIIIPEPRPGKAFYVSRNGKVIRTHYYDNGPDYFEEGRARMISNNKYGYINKDLEIIIIPEFDFAFPFKKGHAIVCNQCKPESAGEHRALSGGAWGVINKDGKVVIPLTFKRDELIKTEEFKKIYGQPSH